MFSKDKFSFVADNTDMFWDSICLGDMWTKLGLVQSLILSPVGPVDPVEKTRIELDYVNSEVSVRFMRNRIFSENNFYFLVCIVSRSRFFNVTISLFFFGKLILPNL